MYRLVSKLDNSRQKNKWDILPLVYISAIVWGGKKINEWFVAENEVRQAAILVISNHGKISTKEISNPKFCIIPTHIYSFTCSFWLRVAKTVELSLVSVLLPTGSTFRWQHSFKEKIEFCFYTAIFCAAKCKLYVGSRATLFLKELILLMANSCFLYRDIRIPFLKLGSLSLFHK